MRPARLAFAALLAGMQLSCGGSTPADPDSGGVDAASASDAGGDAAPTCGATWRLVSTPVTAIELLDPAPLNAGRPVRVLVTTVLDPCDDIAPVEVSFAFEVKAAILEARAWRPSGGDCVGAPLLQSIHRPVLLELGEGDWTIDAAGGDTEALEVTVAAEPAGPCGEGDECVRDCDCEAGQRCLGGSGIAGPFTSCARPCELDRDCGGTGTCENVDDGLSYACELGDDECGAQQPCPSGFGCSGGACEPTFTLGQATRVPCGCDDDCVDGLRCVEPRLPGGERRCEVACRTGGPWCTGAHVCGLAAMDLAGLAEEDHVCIWLGE